MIKLLVSLILFLSIIESIFAQYATPYLSTNQSHVNPIGAVLRETGNFRYGSLNTGRALRQEFGFSFIGQSYGLEADYINETGYINKLSLSKAAEISADRVGLIACGNLKFSLQSLFKSITGLPDKYIQFDYDFFLKQLNDLKDFKNNFSQMYSTHPSILNRIQALIWFSQTHEYQNKFLEKDQGDYSLKEVDIKINKSISEVIGEEHNKQNQEIIDSLKLWVTISLFLIS